MSKEKIPVLAVVGPTASGKTALAVSLAEKFGAEVVSADSMQIYRGMDVATAKPSADETRGVPHHLIGHMDPNEKYSAARFVSEASKVIEDVVSRGKRVIIAGGTGLYVDSLLSGLVFREEEGSEEVRESLFRRLKEEGIEALYNELKSIDPEAAAVTHINNEKRVLRALEIYYLSGEKPSAVREQAVSGESPYDSLYIGLFYKNREELYKRIDLRVEKMAQNGLVEEARRFYETGASLTAVQAIGYKELRPFLDGEITLNEAKENLARATRRYAKRQLTWFGRNPDIKRIYRDGLSDGEVFEAACSILQANFDWR
ncbi:MAG: tRNA (adenosine(37)-N6)-dimethylallyltransferase MiaA [Clostridia bacterium]|nr:tRNA (adenosine(37)-N6)-dimethylallyltransferase MiaA [Clostridia bacterium]